MSETVPSTQGLPEFNGDLSRWNQDVQALQGVLRQPGGFGYEAQLPDVIGHLTEEESAIIDNWGGQDKSYSDEEGTDRLDDIRRELPSLLRLIENDIAIVTSGTGYLRFVEWEKYYTAEGSVAKGTGALHVDNMVRRPNDVVMAHYFLANLEPTVFYAGKAKLFQLKGGEVRLDTDSLDTDRPSATVAAPPYAIVRASGATVHGSPRFKQGGARAFMRATTGLYQ